MKTILNIFVPLCFIIFSPQISNGQILKKLSKKASDRVAREAENRVERRINKKIDKELDRAEDKIDGKKNEEGSDQENQQNENQTDSGENGTDEKDIKTSGPNIVWNRYDFVPGDEVLFEDGPSASEEIGEFPSRWDLTRGSSEIIEVDGTKVIGFPQGGTIVPFLENSKEDYLPEIFTVEFDAHFQPGRSEPVSLFLYDEKNQGRSGNTRILFGVNGASINNSIKKYPNKDIYGDELGGWRHFSVAFTKGKLKVYVEDIRLHNIPHYTGKPTGITLNMGGSKNIQYIKNFRIAKGGVKYYDSVLSEGKIVINGIKFDTNQSTLKPESMGPINNIYKLMQEKPELNFSVEGHTDSDGGDETNMTLSKARGKVVMDKLIELGVSIERLKSNGFGESKPIEDNGSAEGKANNRRVEFVKF